MALSGKRGFAGRQVVAAVLLVIAAFFVLNLSASTSKFALAQTGIEQCRLDVISSSIEVAYGIKVLNIELFRPTAPNPFYINCPTRDVSIENDNIRVDGHKINLAAYEKNREQREQQLKDLVLGELSKCWRSFGDASDTIYTADVGEGEKIEADAACFACSEVFIGSDFVETELYDFYGYANQQERLLDGKSYVEFLTHATGLEDVPEDKY